MKALEINNLSKKYKSDVEAISKINFDVSKGSFHVIIGKNGSGKTTIIKSIVGAYKKFEGQIKIFGSSNLKSSANRQLSYIPEKAVFPKELNTFQYLYFVYSVCENCSLSNSKKCVLKFVEKFNLSNFKEKNPNLLSSGQKKRVLLVQALMKKSKIIIMDEPTASLDPIARKNFFNLIKNINKQGTTILIATHIINEIQNLVNEITIVENGKVKLTKSKSKNEDILKLYKKYTTNEERINA